MPSQETACVSASTETKEAHCVVAGQEEAEAFKKTFNQKAADTWKHLCAGYERSDLQRKRAAALRGAQTAVRACLAAERHKDVEICYMSGQVYLGEHHLGAWRPLTALFEWDEEAVQPSRLDLQQLKSRQRG